MTIGDTTSHLMEFSDAAAKYYESTIEGNSQEVNRQVQRMTVAFKNLVNQGRSGREALLSLVESENVVIAQMAATYSMKYAPERCKEVLTKLTKEPGVVGFGAEQTLLRWEEGTWNLE